MWDYIKSRCAQCGATIYGGDFCSNTCEDTFSHERIRFGHSNSGKSFEDDDLPTVDDVATYGAAPFQKKSLLRENLIKQQEARRQAKIKVWEEMKRAQEQGGVA